MNQKFDDELRRRAIQSNIRIPDSYGRNVDRILRSLLERDRKVIRISKIRRPVAAILACCFLFGSVGVYATVNYVNVRMHEMNDTEIADYQEDLQNAPVDSDTYSREFTEDEKERIDKLRTEYATEGRFPASELLQVEQSGEIQTDKLVFVVNESTFYLPDRGLTDEECLEWIDFHYKRDYSLGQSAEVQMAAELGQQNVVCRHSDAEETVAHISEEEAYTRAVTYARDIIGLDVSQADYKVESVNVDQTGSEESYLIYFSSQNEDVCEVSICAGDGKLNAVRNLQMQLVDAELTDKVSISDDYQSVKNVIDSSLHCNGEIKSSYAEYYENIQNNTLKNGTITYVIGLKNGTGYSATYNVKEKSILYVYFIDDYENRKCLSNDNNIALKSEGFTRRKISME